MITLLKYAGLFFIFIVLFLENTSLSALVEYKLKITLLIYNFSNTNVIYPSEEIQKTVKITLLIIFTGLNSLIFLPFIANLFDKILEEEIEKDQAKKRIVIILIIFVICIFAEKGYLKSTQEGIINIYNEVQDAEK